METKITTAMESAITDHEKVETKVYTFEKIDKAREFISSSNTGLYIFSEDLSASGNKRFHVTNYPTVMEAIKWAQTAPSLYENIEPGDAVKLHLDIDCKSEQVPPRWADDPDGYLDTIIDTGIALINRELRSYDIDDPSILIIKSFRRDGKLSAHIVYNNVVFKTIYHLKFFMQELESELIEKKIIDPRIYRVGCFRFMGCCKKGKENVLKFYKSINYEMTTDEQLWFDSTIKVLPRKRYLINNEIPDIEKRFTKQVSERIRREQVRQERDQANHNEANKGSKRLIPVEELAKLVGLIKRERAEDYKEWVELGMAIFNCNYRAFHVWDEWSKQCLEKYDHLFCKYKWSTFKSRSKGIGSIKRLARIDNPEKYGLLCQTIDEPLFTPIPINRRFLLDRDDQIGGAQDVRNYLNNGQKPDNYKLIDEIVRWKEGGIKSLVVKSAYKTGKTTMLKKILSRYNPKRILWITYRQALTNDVFGGFKDYRFGSYLDKEFSSDRLICQVESLHRIPMKQIDVAGDVMEVPKYDLVIMDEIESILKHFDSPTIKEPRETCGLMSSILHNSDKIIALDGDFYNRGYDFLTNFGEQIVVGNTYKETNVKLILTDDRDYYDLMIDADLMMGRNILIYSMSNKLANHYYEKYSRMGIKTVLHTSKTDDRLKAELKDVNGFWTQFQLVIYSPCIDAGVNFDVKDYFYRTYGILSDRSTTQRGFLQMGSRVRYPVVYDTLVYTNGLPYRSEIPIDLPTREVIRYVQENSGWKEIKSFYTYDEIHQYIREVQSRHSRQEYVMDPQLGQMVLRYRCDIYDKIKIYNELEAKNAISKYFIALLIRMAEEKGYTVIYMRKPIKVESVKMDPTMMKGLLIDAPTIESEELDKLLGKQKKNMATREDKVKIEKKLLMITFGVDTINMEFLDKFYGKNHVLHNLIGLIDDENIGVATGQMIHYGIGLQKQRNAIVREIVKGLGYDSIFDEKKIERQEFIENMKAVLSNSPLFNQQHYSFPLFGVKKYNTIKTVKQFMGFMNRILGEYGLCLQQKKVSVWTNKGTRKICKYVIKYINSITDFIKNDKIKNNSNIIIKKDNHWKNIKQEMNFDVCLLN